MVSGNLFCTNLRRLNFDHRNIVLNSKALFSDWDHTHKVCSSSKYYKGHLDSKNHENVMNCTYYIVFEQNYKNYQWWIDKKERIDKTIKDFNGNDVKAKDRAEAQTKVRNSHGNPNGNLN